MDDVLLTTGIPSREQIESRVPLKSGGKRVHLL